MGYRSDVTINIYGYKDDIIAFVAGEKLKGKPKGLDNHPLEESTKEPYHERDVYDYDGDKRTMMIFQWWDIKWYDSFVDVAYWKDLADMFSGDNFGDTSVCMELAVVGESVDDNTTEYYGTDCEYYLNISRAIENSAPYHEERG